MPQPYRCCRPQAGQPVDVWLDGNVFTVTASRCLARSLAKLCLRSYVTVSQSRLTFAAEDSFEPSAPLQLCPDAGVTTMATKNRCSRLPLPIRFQSIGQGPGQLVTLVTTILILPLTTASLQFCPLPDDHGLCWRREDAVLYPRGGLTVPVTFL